MAQSESAAAGFRTANALEKQISISEAEAVRHRAGADRDQAAEAALIGSAT